MKQSRRAQRMQQHYQRAKKVPSLNVVSLMDIFTILVFFLLVNSSEVEVLPTTKGVQLPESVAEAKPRESVVITVTNEQILLQGKPVTTISAMTKSSKAALGQLQTALRQEFAVAAKGKDKIDPLAFEVTIMGDKKTPFSVLKQVMQTCTQAGYGKISLSVLQKASQEG